MCAALAEAIAGAYVQPRLSPTESKHKRVHVVEVGPVRSRSGRGRTLEQARHLDCVRVEDVKLRVRTKAFVSLHAVG